MVLVKNWQFFHIFNIGKIANQNVLECILERKKAFPDYKSNKLKKVENLGFFQNSPWCWSKTGNVFVFILKEKCV